MKYAGFELRRAAGASEGPTAEQDDRWPDPVLAQSQVVRHSGQENLKLDKSG